MLEKHLVIYPSGELKWVELERLPRYNCVYHGEEVLSNDDIRHGQESHILVSIKSK